jgi:hypothetical protein
MEWKSPDGAVAFILVLGLLMILTAVIAVYLF